MYKFSRFYRRTFWLFVVIQVIVSPLIFALQNDLGTWLLLIFSLISVIHFFGLVAVIFDTNRCARNNSIYLVRLTELLESQGIEQINQSLEALSEESVDATDVAELNKEEDQPDEPSSI